MTELGERSRALLDAARDGDEPSPADRARVRAALAAALAGAPAPGGDAGPGAPSVASGAGASSLAKALSALGLATLVGGAALVATPSPRTLEPLSAAPRAAFEARVAEASAASDAEPPPDVAAPLAAPVAVPASPARVAALRPSAPAVAPSAPSLEAEARALAAAQSALAAGDPARAKALLDAQGESFRDGALGPERSAAEVFALCSLGRVGEARAKAAAFLRAHGGSPLAPRVAAACEGASLSPTDAPATGHESTERAGTETLP